MKITSTLVLSLFGVLLLGACTASTCKSPPSPSEADPAIEVHFLPGRTSGCDYGAVGASLGENRVALDCGSHEGECICSGGTEEGTYTAYFDYGDYVRSTEIRVWRNAFNCQLTTRSVRVGIWPE